jgi:hypothetical protein
MPLSLPGRWCCPAATVFGWWLLGAGAIQAAPPTLTNLTPRGAERGKTVEVVVTGTNLTAQTRLLVPFKATQALLPDAKPNPAQARFQLTVEASVPLGIYPVRVATEDGISGMQFFSVEAFPGVLEVKGNNTFDKAQKVPFPVVINGTCPGGEVGFFRFPAGKGQRVVVETLAARLGSGVLPQIRVTDARQRFLAADDRQSVRGDCRELFKAPDGGEYVVEISDSRYRGGTPPNYRLVIADYDVIDDVFPLGGRRGETVTFTLRAGTLTEEARLQRLLDDARTPGWMLLPLEGVIRPGLLPLPVAVGLPPERTWSKPAAEAKGMEIVPPLTVNGRFEQRAEVHRFQFPIQPGQRFRMRVQAESLGSYLVLVPVIRRGYTGPVELNVAGLPAFVSVQGGHVPAGASQGLLTLTATAEAPPQGEAVMLRIEGKGLAEGRALRVTAEQKLVVSREANPATSMYSLSSLAVGLTGAEPFALQGPPVIEAVRGYPATVAVSIRRGGDTKVPAIEVTGSFGTAVQAGQPPPNQIAFKPATAAADAASASVVLTPGFSAPEGKLDLVLQAKAKINNMDKTVVSAAVPLVVHRPFTVELQDAPLILTPGQNVVLKGRLVRQAVFQEAVQLKLDGLPAGVTPAAPPAAVPGSASDFQIELKVGPKVVPPPPKVTLTCSTNIGGTAYNHPPVEVRIQLK